MCVYACWYAHYWHQSDSSIFRSMNYLPIPAACLYVRRTRPPINDTVVVADDLSCVHLTSFPLSYCACVFLVDGKYIRSAWVPFFRHDSLSCDHGRASFRR